MKYEIEERSYNKYKNFYVKKNYFNIFSFYCKESFDFGNLYHGFPIVLTGIVSFGWIFTQNFYWFYFLLFLILFSVINLYFFQLKKTDFLTVDKAEDFIKSSIKKKIGNKYKSRIVSTITYKKDNGITREFFE